MSRFIYFFRRSGFALTTFSFLLGTSLAFCAEVKADKNIVTDLKFHEFFKTPVGPRGLEPTSKLQTLAGQRVRIIGYMVQNENPMPGVFAMTPLPVSIGDEDESLADDLPPSTLFVHSTEKHKIIPYRSGLIQLTGILELGSAEETDGHVSSIRLKLDAENTTLLLQAAVPNNSRVSSTFTLTSKKEH